MRRLLMLTMFPTAMALLACGTFGGQARAAAPASRFPLPAESELVARVQLVLPAGWAIQRTESKRVPPGWHSAQASATVVTISDGRQDWTLAFVPLDWIGIQFEPGRHPLPDSPDAVSQAEAYKLLHGWGRQMEWTWGEAHDGVRVSLDDRGVGTIAMHVENMGEKSVSHLSFDHKAEGIWPMDARMWVDGVLVSPPPPENFLVGGRVPTIEPGTAAVFVFDVSRHLPPGAVHHVTGSWGDIPANEITVTPRTGEPVQPDAKTRP